MEVGDLTSAPGGRDRVGGDLVLQQEKRQWKWSMHVPPSGEGAPHSRQLVDMLAPP